MMTPFIKPIPKQGGVPKNNFLSAKNLTITLFFIVFVISFCLTQAEAQNTLLPINIDFKNKSVNIPDPKSIRKAQSVYLYIDSLSTDSYKVTVNKRDSFISAGTPPALFGILSFGDGFNSLLSGLAAYNVRSVGNTISNTSQSSGSRSLASTGQKKAHPTTEKVVRDECDQLDAFELKLLQDTMRFNVMNFHFKFRDSVIKQADELTANINIQINPIKDTANFRITAQAIINRRLKYERELEEKYNQYYDKILNNTKYKLAVNCGYLRAADSMLTSYKKGFNAFLNKFDTSFNEVIIVSVYKQITKPKPPQFFKSLPYTLGGDITTLDIEIVPTDASKISQGYATSIRLQKRPQEFWGFSTGVYASGLFNKSYSIQTNTQVNSANPDKLDTLNYTIIENDIESKLSVGINALLHYGWYFGQSNFGASVTFGPGLSLENSPKPRVMIGASLVIGRTNKLMISGGWIGGTVKRLATAYKTTTTYQPAPTDITTDKFKNSWYISLGYAIFGK